MKGTPSKDLLHITQVKHCEKKEIRSKNNLIRLDLFWFWRKLGIHLPEGDRVFPLPSKSSRELVFDICSTFQVFADSPPHSRAVKEGK